MPLLSCAADLHPYRGTPAAVLQPDTSAGSVPASPRRHRRRLVVIACIGVALLLIAGVGAVRYLPVVDAARQARASASALMSDLKALTPGDLDAETIGRLSVTVEDLAERQRTIRELLASDPLVGLARALGPSRATIVGADAVVAATGALLDAARTGLSVGGRFAELRDAAVAGGTDSLLGSVVEMMATSTDEVDGIVGLVAEAESRLAAVPPDAAPQVLELRDMLVEPLARYGSLLDAYQRMDDVLPRILGRDGTRRYLVLAQNPAEIRPTGGFTGTIGILELRDGGIEQMDFQDVYVLDSQTGMPYQEPPEALRAHLLNRSSWELADANWSPDFPTAAQDASRLYTLESGDADIDGVIAITTFALDRLMEVTGPIEVSEYGVTVEPGDVTVVGIASTRDDSQGFERKRFLDVLATTALDRLLATPPARWGELLEVVEQIGRERLALAWFPDPAEQALVSGTPWGGEIRTDAGDYLALVDANVTPSSKLSLVVERSTDLDVTLDADGGAASTLRIGWQNEADLPGEPYTTLREASLNTDGVYGVYSRVLLPDGAQLVDAVGESLLPVTGVEAIEEEAGRIGLGNYLLIEPGPAWLEYAWKTPDVVIADGDDRHYRLTIQKQPGMGPEPLRVAIHLPDGAAVLEATPGTTIRGGDVTLETTLVEDLQLEIGYRL